MRNDRQDAFVIPQGKYYLVDAGYTNGPGFLAPFRSTRYHLKEWVSSQQQPQTPKELYNLRHSRARNVVERTFGLWKKKWAILRIQSFFDIKDQIRIINACCVLHNFARDRQHMMDDLLLQEVDNDLADLEDEPMDEANLITSVQVTNEWTNFRQQLSEDITMAEGTTTLPKRNYVTWDDDMDTALLEVLVHHHNMGDHSQNGWKAHVYTAAIKNVKEKCSKDITKENILGRLRTFDKQFEVISKILSQSGFGWDWVNHKVSIDSDDVWDKYVEANKAKEKGIGSYKTKVVRHWDSISTIYSKDHANGEGAVTGAENASELEEPIEVSPEMAPKRTRTGEAIMCMIGEMRTTFKEALKTTDPLPLPKATPPSEIFAALQLIPNLPEDDMLRSYGKLIINERLFEALMELPMHMRKAWLLVLP